MKKTFSKISAILGIAVVPLFFFTSTGFGDQEFNEWLKKEKTEFAEFRDKRDKEFLGFLKKDWEEFRLNLGVVRDKTPKPVQKPVAIETPVDITLKPDSDKVKIVKNIPLPEPLPEAPEKKIPPLIKPLPPAVQPAGTEKLNFIFYSTPIEISYDATLKNTRINKISKESIRDFWEKLSRSKYEELSLQFDKLKKELKLNDWGFGKLLSSTANSIYDKDQNSAQLFLWFMLTKAGYDTRVGYDNDNIYLLIPSTTTIYNTPNFVLKGVKFFAVNFDGIKRKVPSIYTYKGNYPGVDKKMDLTLYSYPLIGEMLKVRELKFKYSGKEYVIEAEYNKTAIDFFNSYPQTDLAVYFNSKMSPGASSVLIKALKPLVEGKSEIEAVNFILRFVQTAFEYKTDGDQFGEEKYFFRDEIFFYPYSDCEDRAIIFAYLVKNLTGLDVVGLDFPGHIAAAVKFSQDVAGDNIVYNNSKYIISDPTYINANIGTRMPQFKDVLPVVIPLTIL